MTGKSIELVRTWAETLVVTLRQDQYALETTYISIITYGNLAKQITPLTPLSKFQLPVLVTNGSPVFAEAFELLMNIVNTEVTKATPDYLGDWLPLIVIMTNNTPYCNFGNDFNNRNLGGMLAVVGSDVDKNKIKGITENIVSLDSFDSVTVLSFFKWVSSSINCANNGDICNDLTEFPPPPEAVFIDFPEDNSGRDNTSNYFGDALTDSMENHIHEPKYLVFNPNTGEFECRSTLCNQDDGSIITSEISEEYFYGSTDNSMPIHTYEPLPLGYPIEEKPQRITERIAMSQLELLRYEEDRCREQIDKIRYGIKEQTQKETNCMINIETMLYAEIHIPDTRRLDSICKMQDLLNTRLAQLQNPISFLERLRGKCEINMIKELLMLLESFEIEKKDMFQQIEALFQAKVYEAADRQLSCGIKATQESIILLESYLSDHERELHDLIDRRRYIENELYKKQKESEMDEVYSSIFAPAEVKPGFHMLVQVYLHLYEETDKVKTLAQESDGNAERRDYIPLQCKLKKGDKVDVLLNIYGETLLMSDKKNVVWQGSFTKCSFDYFIPKDIDVYELSCLALLSVNGVPVGEMRFITKIVDSPKPLNPEIIAHKYCKVFISYSHQDESKVKFLHEGLELGSVPHFFDRKYLKAGDVFPQVIQDYINSADLFILCWSENASRSEYVQKERMQALERAYPQVQPEKAAKLRIYPMSIEPYAELPGDMKNYYHFGEM